MNEKQTRARYTLEFKQEAVRQVRAGRTASEVAQTLGMPKASLTNWVRAQAKGELGKAVEGKASTAPVVTPEQAEIARLSAYSMRWRTPYRSDGGQHSTVIADGVPR